MDVGLFDDVRPGNGKPLAAEEGECFYQLFSALRRVPPDALAAQAQELDLPALLGSPQTQHGAVFKLEGTVRRITRVIVSEQMRQRFGLHAYYQLDLFVRLEDQVIQLGQRRGAVDPPTFDSSYPVTACVLDLPSGLTEGADLREEVRLTGAFFKLWVYRSRYLSGFKERPLQPSPMLLGRAPLLVERQPVLGGGLRIGLGCTFLILLATIWLVLWRTSRRDARSARKTLWPSGD
jgi:hypothetical protein